MNMEETGKKTSVRKKSAAKKKTAAKKQPQQAKTEASGKQATPKKAAPAEAKQAGPKKQYTRGGSECRVTFRLPAQAARDAGQVALVGDFNGWDKAGAAPMKRLKDGSFTQAVTLAAGRQYRYRFLIDGMRWENDWNAEKYLPNDFASEDSVVAV